jgi:hypothetical protein
MAIVASGQISLVDLNDSKQLQLYISSSQPKTQIYNPDNTSYTPNWTTSKPVLTPQLFIAGTATDIIAQAKSITWNVDGTDITVSNANYTLASTGVKTLTINTNTLSSANTTLIKCTVVYTDPSTGFDVTTVADFEFAKVTNGTKGNTGATGTNAIIGVLSNETSTVPADVSGNVTSWGGSATTLTIYNGATDDTANWAITIAKSGVDGTSSGTPANRTFTPSSMTADTGTVTFTATRSGYATLTKTYTITKSKTGATGGTGSAGQNATAYWLVPSASAIQKNISNVYTPASLSIDMKSQTGTGTPAFYGGRLIISETTDGTSYTAKYTSSVNEPSAKSYTPSAGIKAIKIEMYLAGGTTTLLDTEIIPIVSDGATGATGSAGQDAVVAVVWTPDGNTLRNSSGTLTAQCDVYKGSSLLTSGVTFKWYLQDGTATTASGGDADGGNGWRLLNATFNAGVTGYATSKITIPAGAIQSVTSFKCVATYSAKTYSDVCTIVDVTDPIVVSVIGSGTFKNGQGTSTFSAKLYQQGNEIDTDGSKYTYVWSIYDSTNVKTTPKYSTTSGKTVTIDARDIQGRASLICEVSPK